MSQTLQELLHQKDLQIQELKNNLQTQEDINKKLAEIIQNIASKQVSWTEVGQRRLFDLTTHIPEKKAETENQKANYDSARHVSKAKEADTLKRDVITEPEATILHMQEDSPCGTTMNGDALMAGQPAFINPIRSPGVRVAQSTKKDHQRTTRPHLLKECPVCFLLFPENIYALEINRHINRHFSDMN